MNQFQKAMSGYDPAASSSQEPMDGYFSSENVLGNPSAQNTAQRAKQESEGLMEALKTIVNLNKMSPLQRKRNEEETKKSNLEKAGKLLSEKRKEFNLKNPFNRSAEEENELRDEEAIFQAQQGHLSGLTFGGGGWSGYRLPSGEMYTPSHESAFLQNYAGLKYGPTGSSSGAGAGITGPAQTPTWNVVPYGAKDEEGNYYAPREITPQEKAQREWEQTPFWKRSEVSPVEQSSQEYQQKLKSIQDQQFVDQQSLDRSMQEKYKGLYKKYPKTTSK